ncbi:hypothetical protein [Priestia filamentosa]|nr:hypothetical protein [Priestia filamentosa]
MYNNNEKSTHEEDGLSTAKGIINGLQMGIALWILIIMAIKLIFL